MKEKILNGNDTLQFTVRCRYETDVDGLLILADLADPGNGFPDVHVLFQIHKLCRHDAAGGVFRIIKILVDQPAVIRFRRTHDTLDHIGRQFLHHVHHIVHVQLIHNDRQLRVGDGVDDGLLIVYIKVGKYIRSHLLGQHAEDHGPALFIDFRQKFCHVKLVHVFQDQLERTHLPVF